MTSAASTVPLRELAGPQLLGYFFNWALLGVLNVQVYLYHVTFTRDPILLQCLVYGVFIWEWVQTGLSTLGAFDHFVYNNVDVAVTITGIGWFSFPVMCAVVSMVAQGFFAWRIFMLSKACLLVGSIVLLSVFQGICGIIVGVELKDVPSSANVFSAHPLRTVIIVWAVGSAVVDVIIAVAMTVILLKRKTGIQNTDAVINKIIRLVVETGTLTASCMITYLVLAAACPGTLYYQTAIFCVAKLYANTLVTNLLSRTSLNNMYGSHTEESTTRHISFARNPAVQDIQSCPDGFHVDIELAQLGDSNGEVCNVQKSVS